MANSPGGGKGAGTPRPGPRPRPLPAAPELAEAQFDAGLGPAFAVSMATAQVLRRPTAPDAAEVLVVTRGAARHADSAFYAYR